MAEFCREEAEGAGGVLKEAPNYWHKGVLQLLRVLSPAWCAGGPVVLPGEVPPMHPRLASQSTQAPQHCPELTDVGH